MNNAQDLNAINSAGELLITWLGTLRLGTPRHSGPLAVLPIYGAVGPTPPAYLTLDDAIRSGAVLISELTSASVPTLQVLNQSSLPVLILDGDEVIGGRQNRVANTTLLVPAKTAFELPVSCIEHGRWHETRATFESGEAVYPSLRRQKTEQVTASLLTVARPVADQGAVWSEVASRHQRTGTHSATGALSDAYADRAADLGKVERVLSCPDDSPTGLVAFMDGHALCADLFDSPQTLKHYWSRLVRSYALETLDARTDAEPRLDSAMRLLRRPARATLTPCPSPGLGIDLRVNGNGVVGAALVHTDAVVHAALFRRRQSHTTRQVRTPGHRARLLEQ